MSRHYPQLLVLCAVLGLSACSTAPSRDDPVDPGFNHQLFQKAKSAYLAGDFKTAATLFDNLAQNGNHEAQYSLGYMYYYSKGVTRDLDKAMYWFKLAASQGNQNAKQALLTINNSIAEQKQTENVSTDTTNTPPGVIDMRSPSPSPTSPVSKITEMRDNATLQPTISSREPAAKSAPKPVVSPPESTPQANTVLLTEPEQISKEWIMNQPAKNYTIQMASTSQPTNARRLQEKLSATQTHFFRATVKGKIRYSVIHGSYDSYTKAREQQQAFKQQGYRDTWIRSIESIQEIIK